MAKGMDMMLKSMGVDTDKLKEQFQNIVSGISNEIDAVKTKLDSIERQNNRIELMLAALMKEQGLSGIGGSMDSKHVIDAGESENALVLG